MARTPKSYRVTIANTGQIIDCAADRTILQAAVAAGIDFPYTCASGNCGACISHLQAGKVAMLPRNDAALGAQQAKAGLTLGCRAQPRSDVTIKWLGGAKSQ